MLVLDRADANFRVHVISTAVDDGRCPRINPTSRQVNQFYTRTSYTEPVLKFDNLTPVMYTLAGRMDRCMDDPIWIRMVTPLPEPRVESALHPTRPTDNLRSTAEKVQPPLAASSSLVAQAHHRIAHHRMAHLTATTAWPTIAWPA